MIGQWCNRNENDADWLLNQLLEMLQAGFVPGSGYSVICYGWPNCPRRTSTA